MTKSLIGLLLAFAIGVTCRCFEIPVPAPPKLLGALLVLAITAGYLAADRVLGGGDGAALSRVERRGG
jgi:XapX domain-containing protein